MNIRLNKNYGNSVIKNKGSKYKNINFKWKDIDMDKFRMKHNESSINKSRIEGYNPVLNKYLLQTEDNSMKKSTFKKSILITTFILVACMALFYYSTKGELYMQQNLMQVLFYGDSIMNMISSNIQELTTRYSGFDWELFLGKVSIDLNDAITLLSCQLKSLFYIAIDVAKICSQSLGMIIEFLYAQSEGLISFFNTYFQWQNFSWVSYLALISFVFNLVMFLIIISHRRKEDSKFVYFVPVPAHNPNYLYSLQHNNPNKGGLTMGNLFSENHNAKQQETPFMSGYSGNQGQKKDEKGNNSQFFKGILYIAIGLLGIVFTYIIVTEFFVPEPTPNEIPRLQLPAVQIIPPQTQKPKLDAKKIIDEQVNPALTSFHRDNEILLKKCKDTLESKLEESYDGIEPFLDDLTSFRTKLGLGWNWVKGNTEQYVTNKFEEHVLSEEKLKEILNEVVQQYIQGLEGNINRLNTNIKVGIMTEANKSKIEIPEDEIHEQVDQFVKGTIASAISQVNNDTYKLLQGTILAYIGSEIGTVMATKGAILATPYALSTLSKVVPSISSTILVPAMATVGVNIASSTAVSAMATGGGAVGGATTGASIGSFIPGFGTIIGFVAGLGIGYVIENHYDKKFKENMEPQIEGILDKIKGEVSRSFCEYFIDFEKQTFNQNFKNDLYSKVYKFCEAQNNKI